MLEAFFNCSESNTIPELSLLSIVNILLLVLFKGYLFKKLSLTSVVFNLESLISEDN